MSKSRTLFKIREFRLEWPLYLFYLFVTFFFGSYIFKSICLSILSIICDALHDLVPFAQFKKREKHPWKSVTFSKVES